MATNVYPSMHAIGWEDPPARYYGYYVSTSSISLHEEQHKREKIAEFEAAVARGMGKQAVDKEAERIAGLIYVDQMSDDVTDLLDIASDEVGEYTMSRIQAEIGTVKDLFEGSEP
jgi:hypothetical protein